MACLRIVDGETMLAAKLMNDCIHSFCPGPDTGGDNMRVRVVEGATPRAVVVIVDALLWDGVDLRVLGGKLLIERTDGRMGLNTRKVAGAKLLVHATSLCVGESLMREPDAKVAAHGWKKRSRLTKVSSATAGQKQPKNERADRRSLERLVRLGGGYGS